MQDGGKTLIGLPLAHALDQRLTSYLASKKIFDQAARDLFQAVGDTAEFLISSHGHHFSKRHLLHELEDEVQKEIFCAANGAHSLVDHSRRVTTVVEIPGYKAALKLYFGDDGLHDFVVSFRRLLHHLQSIRAEWQVNYRFGPDHGISAGMYLGKKELIAAADTNRDSMSVSARQFLINSPAKIDVAALFVPYCERAEKFHGWFGLAVEGEGGVALVEYRRQVREVDQANKRQSWNIILSNLLRETPPPSPYKYLDEYLTEEEKVRALALPAGSAQQIELLISFVDEEGACDEALRARVYEWFARAAKSG